MRVSGIPAICVACTRLRSFDKDHPKAYCAAFPDGIPDEIFRQGVDHRKPFKGDHGIRFKLDPAKADRLKAYEAV